MNLNRSYLAEGVQIYTAQTQRQVYYTVVTKVGERNGEWTMGNGQWVMGNWEWVIKKSM